MKMSLIGEPDDQVEIEAAAEARDNTKLFWRTYELRTGCEEERTIGCPFVIQAIGRQFLDKKGVFNTTTLSCVSIAMSVHGMRNLRANHHESVIVRLTLNNAPFVAKLVPKNAKLLLDIDGDKNIVTLITESGEPIVFEQDGKDKDYVAMLKEEEEIL